MLPQSSDGSGFSPAGTTSPSNNGGGETANWLSAPAPAPSTQLGGGGGPSSATEHEAELFSPYCTLDEPVRETIMRDVNAVWAKLKIVLLPMDRFQLPFEYMTVSTSSGGNNESNNEAATNGGSTPTSDGSGAPPGVSPAGSGAAGAANLSENDRKMIQSLKDWDLWGPLVLCLSLAVLLSLKAPTNQASLVFAAVFCSVWAGGSVVTVNAQLLGGTISFFQTLCVLGYSMFPLVIAAFIIGCFKLVISTWLWFDFIFVVAGFLWSVRVSAVFLSLYIREERRFLALYPVFFFYTFLGWLILVF